MERQMAQRLFLPPGHMRDDVFHRPVTRDVRLCQLRARQTRVRRPERRPRRIKSVQKPSIHCSQSECQRTTRSLTLSQSSRPPHGAHAGGAFLATDHGVVHARERLPEDVPLLFNGHQPEVRAQAPGGRGGAGSPGAALIYGYAIRRRLSEERRPAPCSPRNRPDLGGHRRSRQEGLSVASGHVTRRSAPPDRAPDGTPLSGRALPGGALDDEVIRCRRGYFSFLYASQGLKGGIDLSTRVRSRIRPASGDSDWQQSPALPRPERTVKTRSISSPAGRSHDGDLERIFAHRPGTRRRARRRRLARGRA